MGGNLPKKQSTIRKRSLRSITKTFVPGLYNLSRWTYNKNLLCFRTSELFNIWTLHPQSQLEPSIDFKNLLKVFFIVASLWELLWLQLLHQWNFQIYFETVWFGEIEKTWLQNPSHINWVFLCLKSLLIDDL